jgi:hypothetical protein
MRDPVHSAKKPSFIATSALTNGARYQIAVNLFQITDLLDLKKLCEKVVDFRSQNVKWYHLVHLA